MPIAYLAWVLMAPSGPVVLSHAGDVYKLDAKRLDEAVSDMTFLARQARIIPNYANGKPTGFKLFGIRRGSLYGQLGLRNGDIVTHLHGHPLTSPNTALEAYEVVRNARRVELGVDRRGERLTLVYEVVGGDRVDVAPVKYDPTALPRPPPRPPEPRIEVVGRMTGALDVMMGADTADGEITLNLPKVVLRHLTGPIESFAFEKVRIKLKVERDEKATMLRFVEFEASAPGMKLEVDPKSAIEKRTDHPWSRARLHLRATIQVGSTVKLAFACSGSLERHRCRLRP